MTGPSPRMWGEREVQILDDLDARTIPTHVGRTPIPDHALRPHTDHPHACGENCVNYLQSMPVCGPSPRMWGEPSADDGLCGDKRTIPTHVGRTCHSAAGSCSTSDHPHACGENPSSWTKKIFPSGPSPRMWGELLGDCDKLLLERTIPTHVGRTISVTLASAVLTDHPHACGENISQFRLCQTYCGPSPRMWGELIGRNFRAHRAGPSPRMWGEPHFLRLDRQYRRTIPTHVGRTGRNRNLRRMISDHPHACGENHALRRCRN